MTVRFYLAVAWGILLTAMIPFAVSAIPQLAGVKVLIVVGIGFLSMLWIGGLF